MMAKRMRGLELLSLMIQFFKKNPLHGVRPEHVVGKIAMLCLTGLAAKLDLPFRFRH